MKQVILYVHQSADLYGSDRVLLALVANLESGYIFSHRISPLFRPLS